MERPDKMGFWRWTWLFWLANLRLSNYAVCVMSQGWGFYDYHDYPDDVLGDLAHFVALTCKRCGKEFMM